MNSFIMKGDICYSETSDTLRLCEDAYLICENGRSMGVFTQIPEKYQHFEVLDYTGHMIVPGLSDLHVHAPQYAYRGLGMDMELLEWLETYAFPEESGYKEPAYADKAYSMFVQDLKYSPTTRFCAFATIHTSATLKLMALLENLSLIHI